MKLVISNSSSVPIYEQIKNAIIEQIMSGELEENEALPSIRSLAQDIKISVMTIKKSYDELEKKVYYFLTRERYLCCSKKYGIIKRTETKRNRDLSF